MLEKMKDFFGPRCSAIKINGDNYAFLNQPQREVKFCEAVYHSFQLPLQIDASIVNCPGARRSLGFDHSSGDLAGLISTNTAIPYKYINKALEDIPVISTPINNLILGITEDLEEEIYPDIYITYTQPDKVMKLMHLLARKKMQPLFPAYSIHSICGNVFSRALEQQRITVSFGCPESRQFGGVKEDEVIVGIPGKLAGKCLV